MPDPTHAYEAGGWLIGTSLDYQARQTSLHIFDAEHIADGQPIEVRLDIVLPLGLHSNFVAG